MHTNKSFLLNHSPLFRMGVSLAMGLCVAGCVYFGLHEKDWLFSAIFGWLGFCATFLILSWVIIFRRPVAEIRRKSREDDGSAGFVFSFILLCSFSSILAVALLITSKNKEMHAHPLYVPAVVLIMVLGWIMVHTHYIFHYAREYYDEDDDGKEEQKGGLQFPDDENPDYLDFAYYSFCMGCTFQVSDVSVTSKRLRRITMVHGLLAFFMNTFVVALSINLVAGLT